MQEVEEEGVQEGVLKAVKEQCVCLILNSVLKWLTSVILVFS